MEHIILDISIYLIDIQILIVLFASISGVCNHFFAMPSVPLIEGVHMVDESTPVCGPPGGGIMGDELILG